MKGNKRRGELFNSGGSLPDYEKYRGAWWENRGVNCTFISPFLK